MPFNYLSVKRQAALRLAQLVGSDQNTLESAYNGDWLAALDGAEIPISGLKDLILMIEKEIAQVIGNNPSHPARSLLYGRTVNLANLDQTPSVDNTGAEFVGVFDSCADAVTNAPLTVQPTETLADEADDFFSDTELFNYNITGQQIRHTRAEAYLQGCVWDYTIQSDAYDADGDSPLPQVCANMLVNGVVANSVQVGWSDNTGAAQMAMQMHQQELQLLATGMPNLPLASQNMGVG